ncbi:MAG: restriction endonuclease [Bryobacteraceae bacterium]
MAKQNNSESLLLLGVVAVVACLWLISNHTWFVVFALIASAGLVWLMRSLRKASLTRLRDSINQKIGRAVIQNMDQLVRRRLQLVQSDPYGKPQRQRWQKEIEYFVSQHVSPLISAEERTIFEQEGQEHTTAIEQWVERELQSRPPTSFSSAMTPREFEFFCAEQLRGCGWTTRVTRESRDQGVDVVAEKSGIRVVLQCKLYSTPVGNKAVQEATAARSHEFADYGVVVTNNRYTSAAEELAATNKILLLHYTDLEKFDIFLK